MATRMALALLKLSMVMDSRRLPMLMMGGMRVLSSLKTWYPMVLSCIYRVCVRTLAAWG